MDNDTLNSIAIGLWIIGILVFLRKYFAHIAVGVLILVWLWGINSCSGGPGGTPGKITAIAIPVFFIWASYMAFFREETKPPEQEDHKEESAVFEPWRQHRDADSQSTWYPYRIERHAAEALAIRYGIAHIETEVREDSHHTKAEEKQRDPRSDTNHYISNNAIRLQKIRKISADMYEVRLTDYADRRAKAVIEPGTEYVKTFCPMDDEWFAKYADLEETLKGNRSFSLKELATFHVEKVVLKR